MADINTSEVVFFLGAGASVAAGVPDTFSFVEQFIKNMKKNEERETVIKIKEILEKSKKSKIDIELMLETLTKLKNRKEEPLLDFFDRKTFKLKGCPKKTPIINHLKDYIKAKAIVLEKDIKYLQQLLEFTSEYRPLDIISVNYDTCIEQFCNVHKLVYQDGFDVYWNPNNFEVMHTDIRLYKLHGSVMWYQSDKGGAIKLPIMTAESKVKLITGEHAENLILYPMQK